MSPGRLPAANIDFLLRVLEDVKSCTSQHRFAARVIWHPPVRRIAGVAVLDEMQLRISRLIEVVAAPKVIVSRYVINLIGATLHRLKNQNVASHMLADKIERQQRVPQVIQHTHEKHDVEPPAKQCN